MPQEKPGRGIRQDSEGARAAPQRSDAGRSTSLAAEGCGLVQSARTSAWDAGDASVRSRDSTQSQDRPGPVPPWPACTFPHPGRKTRRTI